MAFGNHADKLYFFARRKNQEDEMRLLSRTPPEPQPEHRLGSRDISPFDGFS